MMGWVRTTGRPPSQTSTAQLCTVGCTVCMCMHMPTFLLSSCAKGSQKALPLHVDSTALYCCFLCSVLRACRRELVSAMPVVGAAVQEGGVPEPGHGADGPNVSARACAPAPSQ